MTINPLLNFNGQCEEAFEFYAKLFNGQIQNMSRFAGSPMESRIPEEFRNKIMHATLTFDGQTLMGADPPGSSYQPPQGFSVTIQTKDRAEGERIFNGLAEGGQVGMPLQKTFWSAAFGMVKDRFGIPWLINCME